MRAVAAWQTFNGVAGRAATEARRIRRLRIAALALPVGLPLLTVMSFGLVLGGIQWVVPAAIFVVAAPELGFVYFLALGLIVLGLSLTGVSPRVSWRQLGSGMVALIGWEIWRFHSGYPDLALGVVALVGGLLFGAFGRDAEAIPTRAHNISSAGDRPSRNVSTATAR